jgi:hypothetical protein
MHYKQYNVTIPLHSVFVAHVPVAKAAALSSRRYLGVSCGAGEQVTLMFRFTGNKHWSSRSSVASRAWGATVAVHPSSTGAMEVYFCFETVS